MDAHVEQDVQTFRTDGFVTLPNLLTADELAVDPTPSDSTPYDNTPSDNTDNTKIDAGCIPQDRRIVAHFYPFAAEHADSSRGGRDNCCYDGVYATQEYNCIGDGGVR